VHLVSFIIRTKQVYVGFMVDTVATRQDLLSEVFWFLLIVWCHECPILICLSPTQPNRSNWQCR